MSEFPLGYEKISPTTWIYLSSLLMVGLYFKFYRLWSVRNLDLVLLILLAPGMLLADYGYQQQLQAWQEHEQIKRAYNLQPPPGAEEADPDSQEERKRLLAPSQEKYRQARALSYFGHIWLFIVGLLIVTRLLLDVTMVRRPLLQPNLSTGGLAFLGISLFIFLTANVFVSEPTYDPRDQREHGPGFPLFTKPPILSTMTYPQAPRADDSPESVRLSLSSFTTIFLKSVVVLSQLAIVIGIAGIGYRHFNSLQTGIGVATLYLMLPYVAHMTGRIDHVFPGALIVWGMFFYRRPLTSGLFLGAAMAMIYYPLFLLPLWISFYWHRGLGRYLVGVATALLLAVIALYFVSGSGEYWSNFRDMFGILPPKMQGLSGVWGDQGWEVWYRIPMMVAFIVLSGVFVLWPAQKNLGTLMSCSAAVLAASQFWHGFGGGLFMAWYLPLLLLTIFRPNLEDRVALSVLADSWFPRRQKNEKKRIERAA